MRFIKKWLKIEGGQSIILVAFAIAMLCGVAALVVDTGMVSVAQGQLQNAADAAALAAANDLPSASAAATTADAFAELNGVPAANTTTTTPYKGNANKVEVVCTQTVQYTFARVIGIKSTVVTARAVAEKTGISGGCFGYALFNGSPTNMLSLNSYDFTVGGSVHSNSNIAINGTLQNFSGNVESVKNATLNGFNVTIGGTLQGASIVINGQLSSFHIGNQVSSAAPNIAMPDFSAQAISEATASGKVYQGSVDFNGNNINVDSSIYAKGDITVNASKFTGTGVMIATGNITFNGYMVASNSSSAVCLYAAGNNKSITINGTGIQVTGILYAPNGSVIINGYDVTINGRIIAQNVIINGTKIKILSGSNDLSSLPGGSVTLCE